METTKNAKAEAVDMKLDVVVLGVPTSTARRRSTRIWAGGSMPISRADFRGVQVTPHNSEASIRLPKVMRWLCTIG
jgi:hypothetical protein